MLNAHFASHEAALLAISKVPANSGHSLHKGTPREAFIREFLQDHLSEDLAVGTGEIVDASSSPNTPRPQHDIVVFRRRFPRLSLGGGITAFLAESVLATIEVKSVLDQSGLASAVRTAAATKALRRSMATSFSAGYVPPAVLSYVVAYAGPASIRTVVRWIHDAQQSLGLPWPHLPAPQEARMHVASPSLDGVFVLGSGFGYFDNVPVGFHTEALRTEHPGLRWLYADAAQGSLLLLFLFLTMAASGIHGAWLNPTPYLQSWRLPGLGYFAVPDIGS